MEDLERLKRELEFREAEQVRRERTGDHGRGARMNSPKFVHQATDPHAPLSAYADPRPRPSIAYDPSKDVVEDTAMDDGVFSDGDDGAAGDGAADDGQVNAEAP